MTRCFFDYTTKDTSLYDYQGLEFPNSQGAIEFAEAVVEDLKHSLIGEWSNWSIEVRNAEGKKLLSLSVGTAPPIAPEALATPAFA